MALSARFGTTSDNPKKINKTLPFSGDAVTVNAWSQVDDLTCEFILSGSGYHDENYMEVNWPGITKYYFIEKRVGMQGNMVKLTGTIDALTTYKDTIMSAPAVINRTDDQNHLDPMLKDNKVTTRSVTELDSTLLVGNVISDTEYVYVGVLQKVASTAATP